MTAVRPQQRFVSLQTRFLLGAGLVILIVMVALIAIVERRQRTAIVEEVRRRGAVLAESLAAVSTGSLLLYNYTALEQNVARVDAEADVAYAIVLDLDGQVAAHSQEPGRVGTLLDDAISRRTTAADGPLVQEVAPSGGELLYDFAVPLRVERQRWGTARVGMSRRRMEAQIAKTRRELGLLAAATLALGVVAAALVARRIARPVRQLADGAAAISRGELDQRIEPVTSDEIGRLALAFNEMASQLRQQRTDLEAAHAALLSQFRELSDLKSYTDNILGSLPSGLVTLDLEGRVVTLNAAAEGLTGCLAAAVRGRPCAEVFGHLPELRELLLETLASRVGAESTSVTLARRGSAPVPIEVMTTPLKGAGGQALGVVAVLRDLSAVRQLEEQLRRSDRLAALGTLAAGLAHEIKNPLTSILTFSRHLSRRFGDERFRQRFQSVVPRELERINGIVDGLLRLARPGRLTLAPVHLAGLVDRALELYANQTEAKGVTVVREYALGLPAIPADPEQLYQALVNLVTNALDATEAGGTLTVRIGWTAAASGTTGSPESRERLRVEIEDTGAGISPAQAGNVFNPFFTTKAEGTGLGLAIAHKIIEDHAGTITLRSVPGRGTTFTVLLPLTVGPQAARRPGGHLRPAADATPGESPH